MKKRASSRYSNDVAISPQDTRRRLGRSAASRAAESFVKALIVVSGWTAILILVAIAAFLFFSSWRALTEVGLPAMLSGDAWFPTSEPARFGLLPPVTGSAWVTVVALAVAVPFGIGSAVFISEFSSGRLKETAKSMIEFMAAIPSVVYGLLGLALLVQPVREAFGLATGLTALSAGLVVGVMALPTVVSIAEDALHAVPNELRQGSLALGNNHWQTVYKVVIPSASSGIFAAVMLGLGRAIGETMVVLMLSGNQNLIAMTPFVSVKTLPGMIAGEMGETIRGGLHYSALFAAGLVLFSITLVVNLAADVVLEKQRKRWRR